VAQWHAEPVKVFDNLYFVGMTEYSAWAVTTSQGIILIDTIYDYSVEDEVVNGLKKLGLNPADIKYALVSHAHTDHIGGAKYLQDHFGTRVVMSREDWDVAARSIREPIRPKRDIEMKDGDKPRSATHDHDHPRRGTPDDLDDLPVKDRGTPPSPRGRFGVRFAPKGDFYAMRRRALPRHRDEGGRRRAAVEPHDVRRDAREGEGAGGAQGRRSASVRDRDAFDSTLSHGG
jgi:glyoxylase-like metal-dependent hydrolase (beta-lactamase superfamily II)